MIRTECKECHFPNSTNACGFDPSFPCQGARRAAKMVKQSLQINANQDTNRLKKEISLTTPLWKIWDIELGLLGPLNNLKLDYILLTQSWKSYEKSTNPNLDRLELNAKAMAELSLFGRNAEWFLMWWPEGEALQKEMQHVSIPSKLVP